MRSQNIDKRMETNDPRIPSSRLASTLDASSAELASDLTALVSPTLVSTWKGVRVDS